MQSLFAFSRRVKQGPGVGGGLLHDVCAPEAKAQVHRALLRTSLTLVIQIAVHLSQTHLTPVV